MKRIIFSLAVIFLINSSMYAQHDSSKGTFLNPVTRNYQVDQAVEVESLVPMYFTGGYHFAVGYRYRKFRLRVSVINGGTYNAETAGINGKSAEFNRFYETSPGIFLGYNIWKNLELYTYLEFHTFTIEQKSSGVEHNIHTIDTGLGISYQFFIGRVFYIEPGIHLYVRGNTSTSFGDVVYHVPNTDISPVIRLGARLWSKYK